MPRAPESPLASLPVVASPPRALYVKLGTTGRWEESCLLRDQTVRLGYHEVPTQLGIECAHTGDWNRVGEILLGISNGHSGVARRHLSQVRQFFEADADTLWITFFQQRLWWCLSSNVVSATVDGHSRPVIDRWSSEDFHGRPLDVAGLSGRLTAVHGFRGTICQVADLAYLLTRIRGQTPASVRDALEAKAGFEATTQRLIEALPWRDFELFVDLLFRAAGLQRNSGLGGAMKSIDLDLVWPFTGERFAAQVKSRAGHDELKALMASFSTPHEYARIYLVVHSPDATLNSVRVRDRFLVLGPRELAEMAVRHGLTGWLMTRSR